VKNLSVPASFRRGALRGDEEASIESGRRILALMRRRLGLASYQGVDILDVGCGNKIAQAILRHGIPVRRYVGVDIHRELIEYLREHVTDRRFEFHPVDFHNTMYNPGGTKMTPDTALPVGAERFGLICLLSVFTHLAPEDFESMLRLLHRHIKPDGRLFFSLFIDPNATTPFRDLSPSHPLKFAYYSEDWVRAKIDETGWELRSLHPRQPHIQHHVVCAPRSVGG
jgi:SAM-dependent methyltransferase